MNIRKLLKQKAVYWAPTTTSGPGNQLYDRAVEVKCRWEDKNELYLKPSGEQTSSRSIVYVDRDMLPDGKLRLGGMEELISLDVPDDNPDTFTIQRFDKTPGRKAKPKDTVRIVYL